MQKSLLSALVLGAALAQTAPVTAQTASERVSYADLNLATPAGVATFDRRINAAIGRLCRTPFPTATDYYQRQECRREARSSVEQQRATAIAAARRGDTSVQVALLVR